MRFPPWTFICAASLRGALLVGWVFLLVLGGCGSSSFVGQRYDNFTAYYNAFHNAEKAFEEGLESVRQKERSVDRAEYVSVFLTPNGRGEEQFERAVQKSSGVLRDHPNSKWADDALFLIGKSYFYQEKHAGAAEKFREVIQLDTGREKEARFWLGRTLVAAGRYDEAAEALRAGLKEDVSGPWTARMSLVQGELFVRRQQWTNAAQALRRGLEGELSDRPAARASFLLGQVWETVGDAAKAQEAYQTVQVHDPRYDLQIAAELSALEMEGRHGDPENARARLRELEDDEKNREIRGDIALVRARIAQAQERPDAARRAIERALYSENPPSGTARGRLHYELATLYQHALQEYGRAAAHYDTARTVLSFDSGDPDREEGRRLPEAPNDAAFQADRFRELAAQDREVARLDSLLRLGRMGEQELQSFVTTLQARRRAEREADRAEEERPRGGGRRVGRGRTTNVREQQVAAPAAEQTGSSDGGFLFHNDPARLQEARRQFRQTWGDRPRADNWRRRNALQSAGSRTAEADDEGDRQDGEQGTGRGPVEAGVGIDLSDVPRDSASQAEMEADRAVARYELANALFLVAERPDSARTWYRRILEDDAGHPVARQARYALAETYWAQGDTAAARDVYRTVIERHPDSPLAERARQRLGKSEDAAEAPLTVRARTAYEQAYDLWQTGPPDSALVEMLTVAHRFPDTQIAPRALLASGVIYWHQAREAPDTAPDSLLGRWVSRLAVSNTTASGPQRSRASRAGTASPEGKGARPGPLPSDGSPADSAVVEPTADTSRTGWDEPSEDVFASLNALLAHLRNRYPEAPQTERANVLSEMIQEHRASPDAPAAEPGHPPAADTTEAMSRPPTVPRQVGTKDTADTFGTVAGPETDAAPRSEGRTTEKETSRAGPASDDAADREPVPVAPGEIAPEEGGWTIVAGAHTAEAPAASRAETYRERFADRFPVDVYARPVDGTTRYRVVVGQFASRGGAQAVLDAYTSDLPEKARVIEFP